MPLSPGQHIGPFEIVAPLGAGAMGEVWRARDPRIGREVAIKVLPEAFARDPERLLRFEVEARAAGALNHPNILTVFEAGTHDGAPYVVSELLEGGTLRTVLERGALPAKRAIDLALQAARGLAAAHERGVLHRDLKPENLFVTRDQRLKILDFGLAKLTQRDAPLGESGDSLTATMTQTGVLLGTVGYMSPEQARGQAADARSDLFALGTVLHEMLSGARAFQGASAIETLAAVIQAEASPLPESVPAALRRLVEHLLEKDPAQRFQSARDLAFALESLAEPSAQSVSAGALAATLGEKRPAARRAPWLGLALAALLGVALAIAIMRVFMPTARPDPPRVTELGSSDQDAQPAFSPDGKMLALQSDRDGAPRVWLHQLASGNERAFGADTGFAPTFTPDGLDLLYSVQDGHDLPSLHRASLIGGDDRVLEAGGLSGSLTPDGKRLVFARMNGPGDPRPKLVLREMDTGEERLLRPLPQSNFASLDWSPDGRWIAFTEQPNANVGAGSSLVVMDDHGARVDSIGAPSPGFFSFAAWTGEPGTLLLGVVERRLSVPVGDSYLALHHVGKNDVTPLLRWPHPITSFAIGADGQVAFQTQTHRAHLVARTLPGKDSPTTLTTGNSVDRQPAFSHDGHYLLFASNRAGPSAIWRLDLRSHALDRVTDCEREDWDPAYSPDDSHLLWSSSRSGNYEIWTADADGTHPRQVTHDGVDAENPTMTADGHWIVYSSGNPAISGLWRIHLDGTGASRIVAGLCVVPDVSPDGRYCAYIDDRTEVHVVRLADGVVLPLRVEGLLLGQTLFQPGRARWRPDGHALEILGQERDGRLSLREVPFSEAAAPQPAPPAILKSTDAGELESFALSPDGRQIVFSYSGYTSQLFLTRGLAGVRGRVRAAR